MNEEKSTTMIAVFLLGAVAGASAALLLAPDSGVRTRRRIRRTMEDAGSYIIDTGKDLAGTCEDLSNRTAQLAGTRARDLSRKYKDLQERSKRLAEETVAAIGA